MAPDAIWSFGRALIGAALLVAGLGAPIAWVSAIDDEIASADSLPRTGQDSAGVVAIAQQ